MFRIATGRYKAAIEDYTRALQINPRHTWILYQRGISHYKLGNYREALADLESAAALDPAYRPGAAQFIEFCRRRLAC